MSLLFQNVHLIRIVWLTAYWKYKNTHFCVFQPWVLAFIRGTSGQKLQLRWVFFFWCTFHQSIINSLQIYGSSFQSWDKLCISCLIQVVYLSFLNPSVIWVGLWWYRGYLAEEHYLPLPGRTAAQKVTKSRDNSCVYSFPQGMPLMPWFRKSW